MIHRRWLFLAGALLLGITAGVLFSFSQLIAGTCMITVAGVMAIGFVLTPNMDGNPPPNLDLPVFVVMNPQRAPDVAQLEYIETRQ